MKYKDLKAWHANLVMAVLFLITWIVEQNGIFFTLACCFIALAFAGKIKEDQKEEDRKEEEARRHEEQQDLNLIEPDELEEICLEEDEGSCPVLEKTGGIVDLEADHPSAADASAAEKKPSPKESSALENGNPETEITEDKKAE